MKSKRKQSISKTRKCKKSDTVDSLRTWYKSMFGKLEGMVIAKSKGMTDKVKEYKIELYQLKDCINGKLKMMVDKKRGDLENMRYHVDVLIAHSKQKFLI